MGKAVVSFPIAGGGHNMVGFLRRVSTLGAATALGQAIVALNLVIIVRLLPQVDVGGYSVFFSYAMMLLPVSLLSYEVLLPNVREDEVSALLHGVLPLAAVVAACAALGFSLFNYPHVWALGSLLFSMAVLRLVEFAGIRAQRIRIIGFARTLPHLGFMLTLGGLAITGARNLEAVMWLQVAAFAIPAIGLGWIALSAGLSIRPDWGKTWALLRSRWRNPLLFAPSEIASTVAYNLPVVLVARHFGEAMAAQYGVMLRYVMAPIGLISSVVGNVYHADLAHGVRGNSPHVRQRFLRLRNRLFLLGLAAGLATALLLPPLLRLLLGPGWEIAEDLALFMTPLVTMAVWISPFGVSFYVFERSWELLFLNLAYVVIAIATFSLVTKDLRLAVAVFVALSIIRFLVMLKRVEHFMRGVREA
jgi:O-antigen/teichoic acid export membrane protein